MSEKINESAAVGSIGAHSVAVRHDRIGGMQSRMSLKDFMVNFHKGIANRYRFQQVNMEGSIAKITESMQHPYQVDDAVSRLKDMEMDGTGGTAGMRDGDVITYGIEDDNGALMKVTVPLEQGEEFERTVAQSLATVLDYKKTGRGEDKSLAELLYELKDKFTVVNAEFPTIPKDAIYNADEITEDLPDGDLGDAEGGDEFGDEDELGGDDEELSADDEEEFDPEDEELGDEFDGETSKEDLLNSVLAMLKSQNEREIAQANAEAEQAKARQAELALKASKDEMQTQEQLVAAQAEMDAEKDREKKAKEMAELAKFNYRKKLGESKGFSPLFRDVLLEIDSQDTVASLRRQMPIIQAKYQVEPTDDPETARHKRSQGQAAMRELRIQMRAAREREDFERNRADDEEQQDQQDNRDVDQTQQADRGQVR